MTKRRFLASLLVASLLAGCAPYFKNPGMSLTAGSGDPISSLGDPLGDVSPGVREQADLLYHVLVGEIAGHRNELQASVQHYLQAAAQSDAPEIAERATQIALFANDPSSAAIAAQRWLQLAPDNLDALRTLAILNLRTGRQATAVEQLDKVVGLVEAGEDSGLQLVASMLARESDRESALQAMAALTERHIGNPSAHFAYGQLAAQFNQLPLARAAVEQALTLRPDWPEASLLLARILIQSGETDRALAGMAALVEKEPDSRPLRISYARLLAEAKRFSQARQQFEVLLKKTPKDPELLYAMGLLALEGEQFDMAGDYFRRLVTTGTHAAEAHYYLGALAERQEQPKRALEFYAKVRQGERMLDAQVRIAVLMAKQGDLDGARERLQEMQGEDEAVAVRLIAVEADLLNQAKRYQEAMEVIDQGLASRPDNNDLLYARAMVAEKMDRLDILEADLRLILSREPEHFNALNALGYTLADRTDRYQEALGYIKRALELSPNQPAILDSMGWVHYRMGNLEESLKYLQQAFELNQDSEIAAHLGEVLWVLGRHAEAQGVWQQGLKEEPESEMIRKTVERLKQ